MFGNSFVLDLIIAICAVGYLLLKALEVHLLNDTINDLWKQQSRHDERLKNLERKDEQK